jgi:hypothetical protein
LPSLPSCVLMRLRSSSQRRIWSCTVTGSSGFYRTWGKSSARPTSSLYVAYIFAHLWMRRGSEVANNLMAERLLVFPSGRGQVIGPSKRGTPLQRTLGQERIIGLTWSAVMPFTRAFRTLSRVIAPTTRFGKRHFMDTNRFRTAV